MMTRNMTSSRASQHRLMFCCLVAAIASLALSPGARAQWDRDGYFTGSDERDEPRRDRPRSERRSAPSESYDFDVERGRDKSSGVADVSYFYEALDDGGVWINHPRYGDVWQPYVDENWRPYTLGRWAYSDDYGWTWVSDEPFGWAVYHYGRWSYDGDYGWLWVPGTEWAPAWVAWRQSEDAIGWAPLPPDARGHDGENSGSSGSMHGDRFDRTWVFVRPRYFARPEMRRYVRPPSWNSDLVQRTSPRIESEGGRSEDGGSERRASHIRNRGIAPEDVERLSNRPVPRIRIATVDDPGLSRPDRMQGRFDNWRERSKGEVKIFRPERRRTEDAIRKFRKSQPGSGADMARESGDETIAPAPRAVRRPVKPAPPGMFPGGKPSVAAARPPRFERGPVDAKPSDNKREAEKPAPAPVAPAQAATPPAAAAPPASTAPGHKSATPAYVPTRAPVSGVPATPAEPRTQPPTEPKIINPSPRADATRPTGKRRWDGSGPSGAPTGGEPKGVPEPGEN